jgi:large subunit ribosomal protein L9
MQIILQEDVEKLGNRGEVVEVKAGYARNYLLPQKLALPANAGNLKRLEKIRATLAKRTASERDEAQTLGNTLAGVTVTLVRKAGENDQLFGSVTSADLADALAAQGHKVDKRRIQLTDPIKLIGESMVNVKLHQDVTAQFKVVVTREPQK